MLALFVLALAVFLPACSREPAVQTLPFEGAIMGTRYHVTVVDDGKVAIDAAVLGQQIDDALAAVDNAMTTYRDSELMQLNAAPIESWVPVSHALFDVLQVSSDIHAMTEGAFDPTVGKLVRLWGFGPDDVQGRPDPAVIEAALANTGLQYLEIDGDHQRVRKLRDIELDLSAVAKGYAVDRVAVLLDQQGIHRYLVEVGGEVRVAGLSPRGDAWRVAVEKPSLMQGEVQAALRLSSGAMATSGDYRNFRDIDGQRVSHEIDPFTGEPARNTLASVTVMASDCATADALATGLMAMGEPAAKALVLQKALPVYMMIHTEAGFSVWESPALAPYREEIAP